jgi:hypothetical protein
VLPPIGNAAPDSPTAQALNTIVSVITTPVGMSQPGTSNNPVTTNTGASSGTGGTGASASAAGDTKVDDDKSEKKAEEQKDDKKDVVAPEKSGEKNEPRPPKTFCN